MAQYNGTTGNDFLLGSTDADTLVGGTGNDTYLVNHAGDTIVENANGGNDTVYSAISYALGANIETLRLYGTADVDATGNALNNTLVGNDGNNVLDGASGADAMSGGLGNDTYVVDSTGDTVTESSGAGNDTVRSAISYTLGANVENVVLTGTAAINATGNSLSNVLVGNSAANTLNGGSGDDYFVGGAGNDTMIGGTGVDTVVYAAASANYQITRTGTGAAAVRDLAGGEGTDTVSGVEALRFSDRTVYLDGRNNAAVAGADSLVTDQNTAVVVSTATLLANDRDFDGNTLILFSVTNGAHGTAVLNANGTVTYTPTAGYAGADSFTYRIWDGAAVSTGTVNVTINPVNVAPTAGNDSATGNEDIAIVTGNVLANDSDPETALTPAAIIGYTQGANGTVVYNNDGTFTYSPAANFSGADSFTYTISDGAKTATATVSVTVNAVNDAPVAGNDTASGVEDTAIVTGNVLANDGDVDDTLTAASIVSYGNGANGSVAYNGDGTFTYRPAANFNGTDSFTYTVSDGKATSTATVTVTVAAVDDAPVAAADSASGNEDTAIVTSNVLANDSDIDSALTPSSVVGFTDGAHGTVAYNNDGTFTYTPAADYSGADSFSYTISDGTSTSTATVSVTVNAGDDAPVARSDSASGFEDGTIVTVNVLANDSDVDSVLTGSSVVAYSRSGHGTVTYNGDGTFTYRPFADFNGTDSFVYAISDGKTTAAATVNLTVAAVNDAPVAVNDVLSVTEDTAATTGNVLANDRDVDNPLTGASITMYTSAAHGTVVYNNDGTFTYTPHANYSGSDSFTYILSDGVATSSATIAVTVAAVDDAPIARNDTVNALEDTPIRIDVLANDSDPDSALSVLNFTQGTHGFVGRNADGTLTYTPIHKNYSGADSFTYTVTDGRSTSTASVDVTLAPVNDGPTLATDTNLNTSQMWNYDEVLEAGTQMANGFRNVELRVLGNQGFKIVGESGADRAGTAVAGVADVNGDGLADVLVTASFNDAGGADSGAAYVVFGKSGVETVQLGEVASGFGGFKIVGENAGDRLGSGVQSVSSIGDVNGDGRADLLIGASAHDGSGADSGSAYVVYGKADGDVVDLAAVAAGDGGFRITAAPGSAETGYSVAAAGDVDRDGIGDFAIGTGSGSSYIAFGGAQGAIDLAQVALGNGGFRIAGDAASGRFLSGVGDVNGDGYADVLVGSHSSTAGAAAYVVFGKSGGSEVNLAQVAAGIGGYAILAPTATDWRSTTTALGDVNGDGLADFAVGSNTTGSITASNSTFVLFGKADGAAVDLSAVAAGDGPGFRIYSGSNDAGGHSISGVGDINRDGRGDLIIGAPANDNGSGWPTGVGTAYVVFGKGDGTALNVDLFDHFPEGGLGGFRVYANNLSDAVGSSVAGAGDVNGDGRVDVIIGAPGNDTAATDAGAAYVVFGPTTDRPEDPIAVGNVLTNDSDPEGDSFTLIGIRAGAGNTVASGGLGTVIQGQYGSLTLNADGSYSYTLDNSLAQTEALRQYERVFDVFSYSGVDALGATSTGALNIEIIGTGDAVALKGTAGDDVLRGSRISDSISGGDGNDVIWGDRGADTLTGGAGSDRFYYQNYVVEDGNDLITDFEMGAGGDVLDFKDLLVGYVQGTSNISNFLRIEEIGDSTTFFINTHGTGPGFRADATLLGVTNVVIDDMIAQGNLVLG